MATITSYAVSDKFHLSSTSAVISSFSATQVVFEMSYNDLSSLQLILNGSGFNSINWNGNIASFTIYDVSQSTPLLQEQGSFSKPLLLSAVKNYSKPIEGIAPLVIDVILSQDDIITGSDGKDEILSWGGNDNIFGGNGNDNIYGGKGNDTINGGAGDDNLTGDEGNDKVSGGLGSDTYHIDDLSDTLIENSNEGYDTVEVGFNATLTSYTLPNNIEKLIFRGDPYTANGNGSDNYLFAYPQANHNERLNGFGGNDRLEVGAGNDTLDGGTGNDTMLGGPGSDTYYVDSNSDKVIEDVLTTNSDVDTVVYQVTTSGSTLSIGGTINGLTNSTVYKQIENLTLGAPQSTAAVNAVGNNGLNNIEGNAAANQIYGLGGNDILNGNGGNDTLNGGAGKDTMTGGAGNDTYYVDSSSDVVTEAVNAGTDSINTSLNNFSISALLNIENLSYYGANNATITGNASANILMGDSGNDSLDGSNGNDTLNGGSGNDVYNLTSGTGGSDIFTDSSGIDSIQWQSHYYGHFDLNVSRGGTNNTDLIITEYQYGQLKQTTTILGQFTSNTPVFENVIQEKNNHTTVYNFINILTGTANNDFVVGTNHNDDITGGNGNDYLFGSSGNDTINAGDGDDYIYAGIGNDSVIGGNGNDQFFSGYGNDTLAGGVGNDRYNLYPQKGSATIGSNIITEEPNEDKDTISVSDAYSVEMTRSNNDQDLIISAYLNGNFVGTNTIVNQYAVPNSVAIEEYNLWLDGSDQQWSFINNLNGSSTDSIKEVLVGANTNDSLNAYAGDDLLFGGAGNDTLIGSDGNDSLTGGNGKDVFLFNTIANTISNSDTINDFVHGIDSLQFSKTIFSSIKTPVGSGLGNALASNEFVSSPSATFGITSNSQFIYNTTSGVLFYDADANGSGASVQVALLGVLSHPALSNTDIHIVD